MRPAVREKSPAGDMEWPKWYMCVDAKILKIILSGERKRSSDEILTVSIVRVAVGHESAAEP